MLINEVFMTLDVLKSQFLLERCSFKCSPYVGPFPTCIKHFPICKTLLYVYNTSPYVKHTHTYTHARMHTHTTHTHKHTQPHNNNG